MHLSLLSIESHQGKEKTENSGEHIDYSFLSHPVVIAVTIARFLTAVSLFIWPFWGCIVSIIADILDWQVFHRTIRLKQEHYHVWDKNVDWIVYSAELWVSALYGVVFPMFLLLFYRFIGHWMFLRLQKRWMYFLFPNIFETVYLWFTFVHPVPAPIQFSDPQPWNALWILIAAKMVQEFYLHVIGPWPIVDMLRKRLHGC